MKKLLCVILAVMLLSGVVVSADMKFSVVQIDTYEEPSLTKVNNGFLTEINGETYVIERYGLTDLDEYRLPSVLYNEKENQFFSKDTSDSYIDYIWTGKYYMVRSVEGNAPDEKLLIPPHNRPVKFYDENFNLVSEYQFDTAIKEIGYYDGIYYCRVAGHSGYWVPGGQAQTEKVMKSTDMINWEEHFGQIPKQQQNIVYQYVSSGSNKMNKISFNGNIFYDVVNERGLTIGDRTFGEYVYQSTPTSILLSNDRIYYVEIEKTESFEDNGNVILYESGDDLVVDIVENEYGYRLTTPKQPVYDALNAIKDAPYVIVNDTILGFDVPPVMEDDRTLVPMRFLFEQLGAEVEWDGETRSATATNGDTVITFSIDNKTATVNGKTVEMDVPARLINDKTMVPLRFLSENLGYTVEWDGETRCATVITPDYKAE